MPKKKDSLADYRAKRDFGKTPEPAPAEVRGDAEAESRPFVIHRHEARNLHYDLRLVMEGVLKSWAVPKGFSWTPADKHLAVRTEDHPIEYLGFDGVIPKGEYGAGTMTIWDSGTYVVLNGDGPECLEEGKLEILLDGSRLRGQWHLVKTSRDEKDWLLFKYADRYAREEGEPTFPLDLTRNERSPLPKKIRSMRPKSTVEPFSDPDWIYELRFTGRRLIAFVEGDDARFQGADGKPLDVDLPEIVHDLRRLRAETLALDGVLVAQDSQGRPDGALLERCLAKGETADLVYYVFDLLHYEAWSLTELPLVDRKRALATIVPPLPAVLYVDHVSGRGDELMEVVTRGGLPGVVAKDGGSAYRGGASNDWREIPSPAAGDAKGSVLESLEAPPARRPTRVKITNRTKVYWPEEGITKGQLIDFYDRVADHLVPYLRDRPCHMLRYPDGIHGKSFYHKNVTGRIPDWVRTVVIKEEDGEEVRYVVCDDRDTLLHLVQLGSIDLHPWLSRVENPESPDWAIIDLDPSEEDFSKVIRVAQTVGKKLRGAGLRPLLKTSGASGLHIYVPLLRDRYSYEQARMFCEAVARMTVQEHREIATVERNVAKREHRVYVDFGQNRREQTVVPPHVVRPVPGASVSTPLDWDELRSGLHPRQFDMAEALSRLDRRGDLFRPLLTDAQDLAPGDRGAVGDVTAPVRRPAPASSCLKSALSESGDAFRPHPTPLRPRLDRWGRGILESSNPSLAPECTVDAPAPDDHDSQLQRFLAGDPATCVTVEKWIP